MDNDDLQESQLEQLLSLADEVTGSRERSLDWLQRPLTQFGGLTPKQLIASGRADDAFRLLQSISSGFVG
jgi:hypothetical protein